MRKVQELHEKLRNALLRDDINAVALAIRDGAGINDPFKINEKWTLKIDDSTATIELTKNKAKQ